MLLQPDIPVLGRQPELSQLNDRLKRASLTFLFGPPHVGKTTLLRHFQATAEEEFGYQCGYGSCGSESLGLLRAVADLYAGWLKHAPYRDQVRMLWKLRRGSFPFGVARLVDGVLSTLGTGTELKVPLAARLIQSALQRTAASGEAFQNPLGLYPISSSQAYDLLRIVREVSQRPILIAIDDFERTEATEHEIGRVRQFWDLISEDDNIHLLIGCGSPSSGADNLRRLASEIPSAASILLGPMQLSEDEQQKLLRAVRSKLPVASDLPAELLLSLIDGFPGVLSWWWESQRAGRLATIDDLVASSRDAHKLRYSALRDQLAGLTAEERRIAARAVLLPDVGLGLSLKAYSSAIPADFQGETFRRLQEIGIFDPGCEAPSFGHPSRYDAARDFFLTRSDGRALLSVQARELIHHLLTCLSVSESDNLDDEFYLEALLSIGAQLEPLGLPEPYPSLCFLAGPIFLVDEVIDNPIETCRRALGIVQEIPESLVLVGNVIQTCLDIVALTMSEVEEREVLSLAIALSESTDSAVAAYYGARCIVNSQPLAFLRDEKERSEGLEKSLQHLRRKYPDHQQLREAHGRFLRHYTMFVLGDRSAKGAYVRLALMGAVNERYLERALEIADKVERLFVHGLFRSYPPDMDVKNALAAFGRLRKLTMEQIDCRWVVVHYCQTARIIIDYVYALSEKEAILGDLRRIAAVHGDDELVNAALVYCLYRRMIYDFLHGQVGPRDAILREIRRISWRFQTSGRVLEFLFLALIDARDYNYTLTGEAKGTLRYHDELVRYCKRNAVVLHFFGENRASRALGEIARGEAKRAEVFVKDLSALREVFPEDAVVSDLWVVAVGELLGFTAKERKKGKLSKLVDRYKGEGAEMRSRILQQVRVRWGGRYARAVKTRMGDDS